MRTLWRFIAGFFKWTWRLLNFVREMVLNLFFIFLVLVGVGIWMQVSGWTFLVSSSINPTVLSGLVN